jgi:hypothetical protein
MSSVVTRIESDRRLRIPTEWREEFGPEHEVELVRCKEGILVKPLPKTPVQAALERASDESAEPPRPGRHGHGRARLVEARVKAIDSNLLVYASLANHPAMAATQALSRLV